MVRPRWLKLPGLRALKRRASRTRTPISRDLDYHRSRLLQIHELDEQARSSFTRNLLIGNGTGLVGTAALLSKWPDDTNLVKAMLPAAFFFAVGVGASAFLQLSMRDIYYRSIVWIAHIERMVEDGRGKNEEWDATEARLRRFDRRLSAVHKRLPLATRLSLFVAYFAFLFGLVAAIGAVWLAMPSRSAAPADQVAPSAHLYRV